MPFHNPQNCLTFKIFLFTVAAGLAGCNLGDQSPPKGKVYGKVTFEGKPIPEGSTIVFMRSKTGNAGSGKVDAQGNYKFFLPVPIGIYKVMVIPPSRELSTKEKMEQMTGDAKPISEKEYPEIPKKYRDTATSGETFAIKEGDTLFNLDMKAP